MLQYSFSTVFMAVISCNILIIFTTVCFCHKDLLVSVGYKMFALLLGITFLRFALPFQFPFTVNVVLPELFSKAISFLRYYFYQSEYGNISIWRIFQFVWIMGILVKVCVFLVKQLIFNHQVVWYSRNLSSDEPYARLLDEICGDRPNPFCVFELQNLRIPMLYGICRPRILVPAGMELPEDELRCLLSHEVAHHYNHDILVKLGLDLLTTVYWWNPVCYVLRSQLDAILEMRIDSNVAGDTFDSQQKYVRTLVNVAESAVNLTAKGVVPPHNSIALFNSDCYSVLIKRLNVIGRKPKPYSKALHVLAFSFTIALYLLSYAFIFEARYTTPEENINSVSSLDSGIFAILNEDNTYNIYYNGLLLETIDSLEQHPEEITVFNDISEVPPELCIYLK